MAASPPRAVLDVLSPKFLNDEPIALALAAASTAVCPCSLRWVASGRSCRASLPQMELPWRSRRWCFRACSRHRRRPFASLAWAAAFGAMRDGAADHSDEIVRELAALPS